MFRVFLGVELDEACRTHLAEEIAYLKATAPAVRWTLPENLHLTVKFIGDVVAADLPDVFCAATDAVKDVPPFTLDILGLGCFPDANKPRIVWAGCGGGRDSFTQLVTAAEKACAAIGYEPERRPHHPHVTIGRVKHPRDAEGIAPLLEDAKNTLYGQVDVRELTVFMSELKRNGPEYTPMQRVPLSDDSA